MMFGLEETTLQKIRFVLANHQEVEKAILYGSRAKGNYKNGSDIDLTLCGSSGLTLQNLYRMMDELDDLLLPYSIDLSIYNHIGDPNVIEHIKRVGITFYEKNAASTKRA